MAEHDDDPAKDAEPMDLGLPSFAVAELALGLWLFGMIVLLIVVWMFG